MNILITGGNGYIAKNLSKNLIDYDITSISRKDFDLTNKEATTQWFKNKFFDVIIHTAIKGGSRLNQDNGEIFYQNLQMFYNLYYNKLHFNKFIHFGSGAELGQPDDPYGLSKKIINELISSEPDFYNIRIFGVFDENELDTRFIKSNLIRYINKQPMEIHNDKLMDFFYMKDLILLVEHCMTNNYNSSTDCTYTNSLKLSEIADIINKLDSYQVDININDPKSIESYVGGFNDIVLPYIGLVRGIKETYNKLKEQYEAN